MHLFTILMACIGRYCEAIVAYNTTHPSNPFVAQTGPDFSISRLCIDGCHVMNMTMEDIMATLIYNHILVGWIDYAYMYCLHFMS